MNYYHCNALHSEINDTTEIKNRECKGSKANKNKTYSPFCLENIKKVPQWKNKNKKRDEVMTIKVIQYLQKWIKNLL